MGQGLSSHANLAEISYRWLLLHRESSCKYASSSSLEKFEHGGATILALAYQASESEGECSPGQHIRYQVGGLFGSANARRSGRAAARAGASGSRQHSKAGTVGGAGRGGPASLRAPAAKLSRGVISLHKYTHLLKLQPRGGNPWPTCARWPPAAQISKDGGETWSASRVVVWGIAPSWSPVLFYDKREPCSSSSPSFRFLPFFSFFPFPSIPQMDTDGAAWMAHRSMSPLCA